MKKTILLLFAIPMIAFCQDKSKEETSKIKENTLSLYGNISNPTGFGLFYEGPAKTETLKEHYSSEVIYINYVATSLNKGLFNKEVIASGFEYGIGNRTYLSKLKNKGLFIENFITYGSVKFDDTYFKGKYSYVSLFNPDLGFKAKIAKVINFEATAGFIWKWEMLKGQENVDNKMFDNLVPKLGLKLGYIL